MHRSNLGRETKTSLLSKAILEPENNASFLKPQLIVPAFIWPIHFKIPKSSFPLSIGSPQPVVVESSFSRQTLGGHIDRTELRGVELQGSPCCSLACWALRLLWQLCPVVLQAGGWWKKNPEVDVFFIQKRGGKGWIYENSWTNKETCWGFNILEWLRFLHETNKHDQLKSWRIIP